MAHPTKRRAGFRLKSGAVRIQVLLTPREYHILSVHTAKLHCSISALARTYLREQFCHTWDENFCAERLVTDGKYQRRGFSIKKKKKADDQSRKGRRISKAKKGITWAAQADAPLRRANLSRLKRLPNTPPDWESVVAASRPEDNSRRRWALWAWHQYALSSEDVARIYAMQNGICPLCAKPLLHDWSIDHCHQSGRVRGILHDACNRCLGMIESRFSVTRAASYLATA